MVCEVAVAQSAGSVAAIAWRDVELAGATLPRESAGAARNACSSAEPDRTEPDTLPPCRSDWLGG